MTTTTRPEIAHDERYLELLRAQAVAGHKYDAARKHAQWYEKHPGFADDAQRAIVRSDDAQLDYNLATAALVEHNRHYTGWSRYFLVVSSAGLVHSSMSCSTCNKGRSATQFALLPSFSGLDHKALVEVYGPALCSVCFPEAPTSWVDQKRFPTSLVEVLLNQGEEAFKVAYEAWELKAAAKAKLSCPGSGTVGNDIHWQWNMKSGVAFCRECGKRESVTSTGKFRAHKGK